MGQPLLFHKRRSTFHIMRSTLPRMKKTTRKGSCATTTRNLDIELEIVRRKLSTSRNRLLRKKQFNVAKQEEQAFIITSSV